MFVLTVSKNAFNIRYTTGCKKNEIEYKYQKNDSQNVL